MAGAPALQFFPWPDVDAVGEAKLAQADKHSNAGMLRERYKYYCERVVKGFYKEHFLRFDRQIVLVDCLQPLNSGPQAFNDMRPGADPADAKFPLRAAHLVPPVVFAGYRQAAVCRNQSRSRHDRSAQQYGVAPAATDSGRVAERRL